MKKRILSLMIAILLVLSLSPDVSLAADATIRSGGTYDLGDYGNGSEITIYTTEAVTITNTTGATFTDMKLNCFMSGVNLTLDGVKIENSAFMLCALLFSGAGNTLTLAGASTLQSGYGEPGVRVEDGDALTITGTGSLNVQGGAYAAGLGSSMYSDCGSITIESGTLTAMGGSEGASIGGGENGAGGIITIKGGNVTAGDGYSGGAGIGTGNYGNGGTILIEGGTVHATGCMSGAGIGGAYSGTTESITISGGTITAIGDGGAGIGSGNRGASVPITITGGDITASSKYYGAGIGGGGYISGGTINISNCKIVATGGEGGAAIGGGYYGNSGSITIEDSNVTANGGECASGIGGGEGGSGETILIDGGTVKAKGGTNSDGFNGAGIGGGRYGTGGTITIEDGTVTATGGKSGAGIGSGDNYYTDVDLSGGVITINGGTVTAKGGSYGAVIGCGDSSTSGTIVINGGTVIATGGSSGAGIGGGDTADCDSVTIKGGTVTATGGSSGSGIGGGSKGAGGTITLEAGTIVATGGTSGSGIGGGAGTGGTAATVKILAAASVKAVASSTTRPAIFAAGNALDAQSTANVLMANYSAQKNANTATQLYAASDMSLAAELAPTAKYQSIAFTVAPGTYRVKAGDTVQQYGTSPNIDTRFVVSSGLTILRSVTNATTYNVTVEAASMGGSITADVTTALKGDTVKLTITPYTGWQLQSLAYNDGTNHSIFGNSFVMPAANVTVIATFEEIPDVSFACLSATANGSEDTSDSTKIDLTFNMPVIGLTANDIVITNGTGQVVKGALSGSGSSWTIALASVVKQGEVSVSILAPDGYYFSGLPMTVNVYKKASVTLSTLTVGGTPVSGFLPGTYSYSVTLPAGTQPGSAAATVAAVPSNPEDTLDIAQASALPGDAIVTVHASGGVEQQYTVHLSLAPPHNNPPVARSTTGQTVAVGEDLRLTADTIALDPDGDTLTITALSIGPDTAVAAAALSDGTITVTGIAEGQTSIQVTVSDSQNSADILVLITVTETPEPTPEPTATATPTPKPTATATPTPKPTATATPTPTSTPSPAVTPTTQPSATPFPSPTETASAVTIAPESVERDSQTGMLIVTIDIAELPEGAAAIRLPNGTVVKPDENGKLTFQISGDDDADAVQLTILDSEGTPLGAYTLQAETGDVRHTNSGLLAVLLWILGGLLAAAGGTAAAVILIRRKRIL